MRETARAAQVRGTACLQPRLSPRSRRRRARVRAARCARVAHRPSPRRSLPRRRHRGPNVRVADHAPLCSATKRSATDRWSSASTNGARPRSVPKAARLLASSSSNTCSTSPTVAARISGTRRGYPHVGRPPSSSGLGLRPFTPAARVRIPLGVSPHLVPILNSGVDGRGDCREITSVTAECADGRRWSAHPWAARGLRLLVFGLPILASVAFVQALTSFTGVPTSSLWVFLGWWFGVSSSRAVSSPCSTR